MLTQVLQSAFDRAHSGWTDPPSMDVHAEHCHPHDVQFFSVLPLFLWCVWRCLCGWLTLSPLSHFCGLFVIEWLHWLCWLPHTITVPFLEDLGIGVGGGVGGRQWSWNKLKYSDMEIAWTMGNHVMHVLAEYTFVPFLRKATKVRVQQGRSVLELLRSL